VGWSHVELRIGANTHDLETLKKLGVEIGDLVAIDASPEFLDYGFIVSRRLDDKAGAPIALASLEAKSREQAHSPVDIHFAFIISEEVG